MFEAIWTLLEPLQALCDGPQIRGLQHFVDDCRDF